MKLHKDKKIRKIQKRCTEWAEELRDKRKANEIFDGTVI